MPLLELHCGGQGCSYQCSLNKWLQGYIHTIADSFFVSSLVWTAVAQSSWNKLFTHIEHCARAIGWEGLVVVWFPSVLANAPKSLFLCKNRSLRYIQYDFPALIRTILHSVNILKPTISDKIVETLHWNRVTSENKRIHTPPLSSPFKVEVFVVF